MTKKNALSPVFIRKSLSHTAPGALLGLLLSISTAHGFAARVAKPQNSSSASLPSADVPAAAVTPAPGKQDRYTYVIQGSADGLLSETDTYIYGTEEASFEARSAEQCGTKFIDTSSLPEDRNQGLNPNCFAYAAADVVSQAIGTPVSALDITFNFYDVQSNGGSIPFSGFGGQINRAILESEPAGYCPNDVFPSSIGDSPVAKKIIAAQLLKNPDNKVWVDGGEAGVLLPPSLGGFMGFFATIQKGSAAARSSDAAGLASASKELSAVFSGISGDQIAQILSDHAGESNFSVARNVINGACSSQKQKPAAPLKIRNFAPAASSTRFDLDSDKGFLLFPEIDRALDNGRVVAIGFDAGRIVDSSRTAIMSTLSKSGGHKWHASSIIGRRFDGSSCQYLVRGSWGKTCVNYAGELQSHCDPSTGNIWVPESLLQSGLASVLYLER